MIFTSTWDAYSGPGRLALFGPAAKGVRRGYRVIQDLLPGAEALAAPDDVAFRKLYSAQLREMDARAVARACFEAVYPSVPVWCVSDDPDEADALALAALWLTMQTGMPVMALPERYRSRTADPRTWRPQAIRL